MVNTSSVNGIWDSLRKWREHRPCSAAKFSGAFIDRLIEEGVLVGAG